MKKYLDLYSYQLNYVSGLLNTDFITTIKIINICKITSYKLLGPILLSLLLCLKAYALKTSEEVDDNLKNQYTQELLLAEFALNNNNPLKALEIYQKIAINTNNPQIAKRATELALENNKDLEALKTASIWADYEPSSTKALLVTSLLLIEHKSIDDASKYLTLLLQQPTESTSPYIDLLMSHPFDNDKFIELQQHLIAKKNNEQYQKVKDSANYHLLLALLYDKNNNGKKSLEHINKALEYAPKLQAAHINKIRLLNIYQSTESAINYLDQTIESFPDNHELRKLYADILFDLENWQLAKKHYEILSKQDVYNEDALMQVAYINITNNHLEQAKTILSKLINSDNYGNIANYYLGLMSQQDGNSKDALKHFKAIEDGEYFIRGKIRIASILIEENQLKEAQQAIATALDSIEKNNANSYVYSKEVILSEAELLYQQGLYNDAMIILKDTERMYPQDQDIVYSIGILARKLDDPDLFVKNMTFVIEKEPNNSNALSALGWHYYETDNNQKAHDFLSKAYDLGSNNDSKIGARYAAVLWKMGQKDKANTIWQKAVELDPQNEALRDMIEATKNKYQ